MSALNSCRQCDKPVHEDWLEGDHADAGYCLRCGVARWIRRLTARMVQRQAKADMFLR